MQALSRAERDVEVCRTTHSDDGAHHGPGTVEQQLRQAALREQDLQVRLIESAQLIKKLRDDLRAAMGESVPPSSGEGGGVHRA